jgi:anti-anti-sigma factor
MALESRSVSANHQGSAVVGRDGDRIVVWLDGEHDIATSGELSATLVQAIAIGDDDLVVDLSEVQFMDASTIGVIVRARNLLLSRARSLSLRDPARCARRVLDVCGLAELIDSGPRRSETAGALGSWVAVPASDRAEHRADGSVPAGAATSGDSERAGEGVTVLAARRRR